MCRNIRTLFNFDPPATQTAAPRDREEWAARAKARAAERYQKHAG